MFRQAAAGSALLTFSYHGLERRRLVNGHFRQNLAVDLDTSLAEAVDKSAVGQSEFPHCRVDALDPERAERALLFLRSR